MASAEKGGGQSLQLKETQLPTHQEVCARWRAAFSPQVFNLFYSRIQGLSGGSWNPLSSAWNHKDRAKPTALWKG